MSSVTIYYYIIKLLPNLKYYKLKNNLHINIIKMVDNEQDEIKSVKKIHYNDVIELDGYIFFIPDKYLDHQFFSKEYKKCYKHILALCILNHYDTQLSKLTKPKLLSYIQITDKIFAYLESGQLIGSYNISSSIEKYILNKIPQNIFSRHNPLLTEKLEV
jgi:hypothetical protein